MISLTLPWPPTANTVWRNVNGRTVLSQRGREYRGAVAIDVAKQLANAGVAALGRRLTVEVLLYPPDRRRRDIDNYNKALLDAITHSGRVWVDDSQIDQLTIKRREQKRGGYCVVNINEIGEEVA